MRFLKISMTVFSLLACFAVSGARGAYETGGTPLLADYFDPKYKGLVENLERHHIFSNPYLFGEIGGRLGIDRLISEGEYGVALKELQYSLDRICNHPKALEMMEDLSIIVKDPMLGIFYYKRAIILYPQYAITHYQFGSFLISIGQLEEGIEELKRAVKIEPSFGAAYALLSSAYAMKGEAELARMAEEKARESGYKGSLPDNVIMMKNPDEIR